MKKKIHKRNHSGFVGDSDLQSVKKSSGAKGSKRRLSIYDDYEEDDRDFIVHEKFKKRHN